MRTAALVLRSSCLAALCFAALSMPARAQATGLLPEEKCVPEVGEPGDTIAVVGMHLENTAFVRFGAVVGGFVGFKAINVVPSSVSGGRVEATVPAMNAFVPPIAGSDPIGVVTCLDSNFQPISPDHTFWYLEITFGDVKTEGVASTPTVGPKPVISFKPTGNAPDAGNPDCVLLLEQAPIGADAFLIAGFPDMPPYNVIGSGEVVIDFTRPYLIVGPVSGDANGTHEQAAPIPAALAGATLALQWFVRETGTHNLLMSNAIVAKL